MESPPIYPRLIRRVRAVLIDSAIAIFVVFSWWYTLTLIGEAPGVIKVAYPLLAWVILDPVMVSRRGFTPGHYIMGLSVQNARTSGFISMPRAMLRLLVKALTGWWSFAFALMTERHQALHDILTESVVVLRDPSSMEGRERLSERKKDLSQFQYPSPVRRILVILAYTGLSYVVYLFVMVFSLSEACIVNYNCSKLDGTVSYLGVMAWFFSVAAICVCGWTSRLYGARRQTLAKDHASGT